MLFDKSKISRLHGLLSLMESRLKVKKIQKISVLSLLQRSDDPSDDELINNIRSFLTKDFLNDDISNLDIGNFFKNLGLFQISIKNNKFEKTEFLNILTGLAAAKNPKCPEESDHFFTRLDAMIYETNLEPEIQPRRRLTFAGFFTNPKLDPSHNISAEHVRRDTARFYVKGDDKQDKLTAMNSSIPNPAESLVSSSNSVVDTTGSLLDQIDNNNNNNNNDIYLGETVYDPVDDEDPTEYDRSSAQVAYEQNSQPEQIFVFLIDFDQCIRPSQCKNYAEFVEKNKVLFDHIEEIAKKNPNAKIILMPFSNRQTPEIDQYNSAVHAFDYSSYECYEWMFKYFSIDKALKNIYFDPVILADLTDSQDFKTSRFFSMQKKFFREKFHPFWQNILTEKGLEAGKCTYQARVPVYLAMKKNTDFPLAPAPVKKIRQMATKVPVFLTIWTYLNARYPNSSKFITAVDDNKDLLDDLITNLASIPNTTTPVKINFLRYEQLGDNPQDPSSTCGKFHAGYTPAASLSITKPGVQNAPVLKYDDKSLPLKLLEIYHECCKTYKEQANLKPDIVKLANFYEKLTPELLSPAEMYPRSSIGASVD